MHCCEFLLNSINDDEYPIYYSDKLRIYGIDILDGGSSYSRINLCPWCGVRFPKELSDEWYDLLEEQGIEPWKDEIPKEFQTSEWWKKRNL